MNIRVATPADADAITAIYVPMVVNTSIPFELIPPSVEEMRSRIVKSLKELPWLVCDDELGAVAGCVYAGKHRERPAYKWSVDVTAHVREDCRGQAVGKRLYQALFTELSALGCCQAFAGIALPATRASRCMNRWASCRSASSARWASNSAHGTTWAGGRSSFARPPSRCRRRRFRRNPS